MFLCNYSTIKDFCEDKKSCSFRVNWHKQAGTQMCALSLSLSLSLSLPQFLLFVNGAVCPCFPFPLILIWSSHQPYPNNPLTPWTLPIYKSSTPPNWLISSYSSPVTLLNQHIAARFPCEKKKKKKPGSQESALERGRELMKWHFTTFTKAQAAHSTDHTRFHTLCYACPGDRKDREGRREWSQLTLSWSVFSLSAMSELL